MKFCEVKIFVILTCLNFYNNIGLRFPINSLDMEKETKNEYKVTDSYITKFSKIFRIKILELCGFHSQNLYLANSCVQRIKKVKKKTFQNKC